MKERRKKARKDRKEGGRRKKKQKSVCKIIQFIAWTIMFTSRNSLNKKIILLHKKMIMLSKSHWHIGL